MRALVTGAAGFLGRRLVEALLNDPQWRSSPLSIVAADVAPCPMQDPRVDVRTGSIADRQFVDSLADGGFDAVYHLAAIVSGEAEAEFDRGMAVNVDGTRALLEACRRLAQPPRFVFASTIAVFGGALPAVVPGDWWPRPQSSYGAEKVIGEVLVVEYSRRGFVDGVAVRLPTVAVRPGRPNAALSSFVSGIIREPLAGIDAVCPVPLDTRLWICSPGAAVANLLHAGRLPDAALEEGRVLNLPGLTVTPREMLDALERVGGAATRARVRCEPDPRVASVVGSWAGALDVSRALHLGFQADAGIDAVVEQFARARAST
ncbi:MAG TPA: D-erythronate dehydrogenase [Vicinamibacterales bacterium]|nr:D-erythronate dehydrogenase [Vicinamibacterales bacterium]